MSRRHNCQAQSNARPIRHDSVREDCVVTTWGCRRCPNQWCTLLDPAQAARGRLEALRQRVAQVAAKLAAER